jgi:hypothetical protein
LHARRSGQQNKHSIYQPADPIVGEMISAWEKVRPNGVKLADRKTGEVVDFLFLFRLTVVGKSYPNKVLIPSQGANDALRIAGVARPQHTGGDAALCEDYAHQVSKVIC